MTEYEGLERTSATERLRALLDERGVEWSISNEKGATFWTGQFGIGYYARQNNDGETLHMLGVDLTPEQAVAATLGPGTCEVEESWHGESEMVEYHCTACDEYMAVEVVKPDGAQPPNYCPNCGRKLVD